MKEQIKINVHTDDVIYADGQYDIIVELINLSDTAFENITVEPKLIPRYLIKQESPENIEIQNLIRNRNAILREMELQTRKAYEQNVLAKLSKIDQFLAKLKRFLLNLFNLTPFFGSLTIGLQENIIMLEEDISIPDYVKQAMRISNMKDIERVEKEFIQIESTSELVKKSFKINKDKIKELYDEIVQNKNPKENNEYSLEIGSSISFPFKARAPFVYKETYFKYQFQISGLIKESKNIITLTHKDKLLVSPTGYTITSGVVIGAILGFIVKRSLLENSDWFNVDFWTKFSGSLAIGLILALVTVKTGKAAKSITASDFIGGIIIGALGGLFSDDIVDKLKDFVK